MKPLKVSEVNNYIKRVFAGDIVLSNLEIEGEVSNFKHHNSGHMYFSLKDDKSKIRCVFFKRDNENGAIKLSEGMKVVASGYISVYDRDGDYQLYVRSIRDKGIGDLYKSFDDLKRKLEKEGLFQEKYKKDLPFLPKKIGVVTSKTGAAIRDIVTILKRRYPPCEILIYPASVQGANAAREISKGLKYLDNRGDIDLIITGRGGGSYEELFAFNDEELARIIFSLKTPIISAVGHETDYTITDFVSDLRAPTPSAAAELAVPDFSYLSNNLRNKYETLLSHLNKYILANDNQLKFLNKSLSYNNPILKLKNRQQDIDNMLRDLNYSLEKKISKELKRLLILENRLRLLDPRYSLDKGYGILYDVDGNIVKSIDELKIGYEINILLKDGTIRTVIIDLEKEA
ncbi:exodeoxyribonuclease VII large subunit [Paratissierella segnis]|jgi:exodeoxyribonuclease VII large subunit|uniref:Exodeoxyribonuclease 7 large subunit n=1 Tax=Paratissierella segnis TaxID=2763679 RepID=A0A926IL92_9FIRM|nr:exodeoxyribonuclease VII large subunit [Paratissierella segnis]MBC8588433.1 exodeoxyribonuclease VII large subunit [Paratissierella segnis]